MQFEEALRTLVRLIEATAERPFGLLAILAFACTSIAYLVLRDVNPRVSGRLIWLVFASMIAVSVAVLQTQKHSPALRYAPIAGAAWPSWVPATGGSPARGASATVPVQSTGAATASPQGSTTSVQTPSTGASGGANAGASVAGTAQPSRSAHADGGLTATGTAGAASSSSGPSSSGTVSGATSADSPSDGQRRDDVDDGRRDRIWVAGGTATREVTTADHRCPNPAAAPGTCDGQPTRTTYRINLDAGASERLSLPELRCIDGPCGSSAVAFTRISPDGRSVEAAFDVWAAPTRWRLTARREILALGR